VPVVRPAVTETTALSAAYLGGLGVGSWQSNQLQNAGEERRFEPRMGASQAHSLRERWE
jgi:glycerol kinase